MYENVDVDGVVAFSASASSDFTALYKLFYLLTYLLTIQLYSYCMQPMFII